MVRVLCVRHVENTQKHSHTFEHHMTDGKCEMRKFAGRNILVLCRDKLCVKRQVMCAFGKSFSYGRHSQCHGGHHRIRTDTKHSEYTDSIFAVDVRLRL